MGDALRLLQAQEWVDYAVNIFARFLHQVDCLHHGYYYYYFLQQYTESLVPKLANTQHYKIITSHPPPPQCTRPLTETS